VTAKTKTSKIFTDCKIDGASEKNTLLFGRIYKLSGELQIVDIG